MLRSPFGNKSEAQVLQALLAWSQGDAAMAAAAAIPQYSRELQGLLQSMLQVRAAVEHWVGLLSDSGWTTALLFLHQHSVALPPAIPAPCFPPPRSLSRSRRPRPAPPPPRSWPATPRQSGWHACRCRQQKTCAGGPGRSR